MNIRYPFLIVIGFWALCTNCNRQPAPDGSRLTPDEITQIIKHADTLHNAGLQNENTYTISGYQTAILLYDSALRVRKSLIDRISEVPDSCYENLLLGQFKSLHNRSNCYYALSEFDKSKEANQLAFDFIAQCEKLNYQLPPLRYGRAYERLGQINTNISGLQDARQQYDVALDFFKLAENEAEVAAVYNDLSELYVNWRQPDSTIYYGEKALDYFLRNPDTLLIQAAANNLAIGYKNKGYFDKALTNNDLSLKHVKPDDSTETAKIYHNKAKIFRGQKRFNDAHRAVDKAIALHQRLGEQQREKLAGDLSNKAEIFIDEKNGQLALQYAERAIFTFLNRSGQVSIPDLFAAGQTAIYIGDKANFLEALKAKARALTLLNELEKAQQAYNDAIIVTDRFRYSFPDNTSKLQMAEVAKQIFEGAIAVAFKRNNIESALQYAEKSKAFVLWESVKRRQLTDQHDAPIYQKFNQLASDIAQLDRKIASAAPDERSALLQQQSANQVAMKNLQTELEKDPQYLRTVELFAPLSVSEIQGKLLESKQLMVEFFVGDSASYVFFLNKQQAPQLKIIPISRENLLAKTENLLWSIQAEGGQQEAQQKLAERFPAQDARSVYHAVAYELFQLLFPSEVQQGLTEEARLLIVPDDFLGYLPFDALLTAPPAANADYHSLSYLGKLLPLSYNYSATLLKEMQANRHSRSNGGMLAFAYQNPDDHFDQQVKAIRELLGKSFVRLLSNNNTKEKFKKIAGRYNIIHLATHGKVDDRDPGYSHLLLSNKAEGQDSVLFLYDLYDLHLGASLVFTSACDAGIGKLYKGEGLMSLARGFSLAGAGSIITTIWNINQEKQNALVTHFYQQLHDNASLPKDVALHKAKQQYLLEIAQPTEAAPYFWAGLIPIGDMQTISVNDTHGYKWIWWLLASSLLLLGTWGFMRLRTRQ